ncbi:MAG TPA: YfcE family phosphodiesterase [Planctomycetaceae bacterium]|nr:YfcE family phosphodiesterase [Planctomycetaceae bacterium]
MRIGLFADAHDHVDNVCRAVAEFNRLECSLVIFAGDFVSPIIVPPLRKLRCPVLACFGDNDGNQTGLQGGMRIIGPVAYAPFGFRTPDGVRILVAHIAEQVRGLVADSQVVICAHTHKPAVKTDENGVLFVNPGETGGWTYRKPTIGVLETRPLSARIISLPEMTPAPQM